MNFADRWDLQIDAAVDKALKKFPRHDVEGIDVSQRIILVFRIDRRTSNTY